MYSSTLSLTSALDGVGWLTPRPRHFPPGKNTRYPLYRRVGGPQGRSGRVRKKFPPPLAGFYFSILLYSVCTSSVLVSLSCLSCVLPFVLRTHHTNFHAPNGIQTRNPTTRSDADRRLTPLGHCDQQVISTL